MRKNALTIGGLILAAIVLFGVNIAANSLLTTSRVDLTANRLFTLTEGTKNILAKLDEPVTLRLFLSEEQIAQFPGVAGYARRVVELLREYERHAAGKLTLRVIDPEPFSDEEDRAVGYGLRGVALDDGASVLYFGLVGTGATDEQEIIPFFSQNREEFLEHDLTKLIYQLANPKGKLVGLIAGLPVDGAMPAPGEPALAMARPWVIMEQIRQLFEVRDIDDAAQEIPADVDVLMIVHPKELAAWTLYAIDQYVLGGGRALVFVDPNAEADRSGPAMLGGGIPGSSDMPALFKQWRIQRVQTKVAADLQLAEQVRFAREGRAAVADYPVWMNIPPSQYSSDDIVTGQLGNMVFATAGVLEIQDGDGPDVLPLIQTTANAMQVDASLLRFLDDPSVLLREYQPGGTPLVLAARISGRAKTAFPDGRPVEPEAIAEATGEEAESSPSETSTAQTDATGDRHLTESAGDINVIVVADTDLLSDRFWVQTQNLLGTQVHIPTAANGTFVINALESLVGSSDLISVRSRGQYSRPFTKVAEIQQGAELEFRQKERELLDRLSETEAKLADLETRKQGDDSVILNDAQLREIENFRQEKIRIRKELRNVRHELHKHIASLESWMKFLNIGLMPILVGLGGVLISLYNRRRYHKRMEVRGHAH